MSNEIQNVTLIAAIVTYLANSLGVFIKCLQKDFYYYILNQN